MRTTLLLLLLLSTLSGCATVNYEKAPDVSAHEMKTRIEAVSLTVKQRGFEESRDQSGAFRAPFDQVHAGDLLNSLENTGFISRIGSGETTTGYSIKVNTFTRMNNNRMNWYYNTLAFGTLTLLPMTGSIDVISDIEIMKDGHVRKTAQFKESSATYFSFFFPHIYLFGSSSRNFEKETANKIAYKIIHELAAIEAE